METPKPGSEWTYVGSQTRYIVSEIIGGLIFYRMKNFSRVYNRELKSFLVKFKPVES